MSSSQSQDRPSEIDEGPERKKFKPSLEKDNAQPNDEVDETEGTQEYNLDRTQEYSLDKEEPYGVIKQFDDTIEGPNKNCNESENGNGEVKHGLNGHRQSNGDLESNSDKPGASESHVHEKPHPFAKIESVQRDAVTISDIIPDVDVNEVYKKILKSRHEKNRIEMITNTILENMNNETEGGANKPEDLNDQLFEDVAKILETNPDADPSFVYSLLENSKEDSNRVEKVLAKLDNTPKDTNDSGTSKPSDKTVESTTTAQQLTKDKTNPLHDPEFKRNPLYRDLRTLVKVLPTVDPNELYAYLEAHFNKPNRVQIVIDELTKSDSQESLPLSREPSIEDLSKGKGPQTAEDKLQSDLKELKDIFRDCDPNYLYEKLVTYADDDDDEKVHKIATSLFENRDYPKLKDLIEADMKDKEKRRITEMDFDMKTFLSKFPDPFAYFNDMDRVVNENYRNHLAVYLKNTYPQLKAGYIKKTTADKKDHLLPTILEIEAYLPEIHGKTLCLGGGCLLCFNCKKVNLCFSQS